MTRLGAGIWQILGRSGLCTFWPCCVYSEWAFEQRGIRGTFRPSLPPISTKLKKPQYRVLQTKNFLRTLYPNFQKFNAPCFACTVLLQTDDTEWLKFYTSFKLCIKQQQLFLFDIFINTISNGKKNLFQYLKRYGLALRVPKLIELYR